jgi:hypothetical protein
MFFSISCQLEQLKEKPSQRKLDLFLKNKFHPKAHKKSKTLH